MSERCLRKSRFWDQNSHYSKNCNILTWACTSVSLFVIIITDIRFICCWWVIYLHFVVFVFGFKRLLEIKMTTTILQGFHHVFCLGHNWYGNFAIDMLVFVFVFAYWLYLRPVYWSQSIFCSCFSQIGYMEMYWCIKQNSYTISSIQFLQVPPVERNPTPPSRYLSKILSRRHQTFQTTHHSSMSNNRCVWGGKMRENTFKIAAFDR